VRGRAIALIAAAVALCMLTACSGDDGPPVVKAAVTTAPVTISYAHEQQFSSYNSNTATQDLVRNTVVLNQVLRGFWNYGPDGAVLPDREFGTYQKVSDNPLTVRYDFNAEAAWSDGEPIDCDDAVLAWAANSNQWPAGAVDPVTSLRRTAFQAANTAGWEDARRPGCTDGDRSFTLTYRTMYADWPALFGAGQIMPAHILEQESGVPDLIEAVRQGELTTMLKLGDVYNSLWVFRPGHYNEELAPSAGPYQVTAWKAGMSLTLTPNPAWWGTPPRARTIVIRFIPQDEQAAALRDGDIQVMDPQPNPDLLSQLKKLGAAAVVSTHDEFSWEHVDFNLRGAFGDRALREAFAKCLPRQEIVDNLVAPENPRAQVLQSRFQLPFQPGYGQLRAQGGEKYLATDPDGAKRILQAQDGLGMTVRVAYQTPNPRRKAEVDLLRDFCGRAGFAIEDAGSADFFDKGLAAGDFDVALYAWSGSPMVSQHYATYVTGGGRNHGGYSNPAVDVLLKRLNSELGVSQQVALQAQIDTILWQDLPTIPLFAFPAVLATSPTVGGVRYNASQAEVTYNMHEWFLR
jgi:peptide/nickel transport system substrate-binding protein